MLNSFESAWRYPIALVFGLLVGIYVGGMLATIYVIVAFRQSLDTRSSVLKSPERLECRLHSNYLSGLQHQSDLSLTC